MTSPLGPEVPPGSSEHRWVQLVIAAVEKGTGVPSRWNGKLHLEPDPKNLGTAHPDGTMTISGKLLDRVKDAYLGKKLSPQDLYWLRDAVMTVIHEAKHLSSRLGDPSVPGATPFDAADRALEEGRAEQWSHEQADNVIHEIKMSQFVPGVVGQPNVDAYRAYSGAEGQLANGLAQVANVRPQEVRRVADLADRTQRWNRLADLIIDQRLANNGLMPPDHRDAIRKNLTDHLRAHFSQLPAVQDDKAIDSAAKFQQGTAIGQAAVVAVAQAVDHAEAHYRDFYAQQAARQAQAAQLQQQQGGPGHQQPGAGSPAGQRSPGSKPFWEQGVRGQALKAEEAQIEHLKKFLGGQAPARPDSGAVASRAGSDGAGQPHHRRPQERAHQPER